MVDLNRPIFLLLKDVAPVELEFPSVSTKMPLITLTEVSNTEDMSIDGKEVLSNITFQVDVWDSGNSRQRCEELSCKVNEIMTENGFARVLGRGFKDPSGLNRKTMYFKINIINL